MLMAQAEDRVADNDRQAEYKRVRAIVAEAGRKGTTKNEIARRLKGVMDKRRMDDIVDLLAMAGEVVEAKITGAKGGRPAFKIWTAGLEPAPEPEKKEAA
jgi:pantothenate kinase